MNNNDIVPGFDDEKDESLKIRLQKIDDVPGCLVLYLTGYIDMYNANYFQKCVAKSIESGFTMLIFHLAGFNMVSDEIIISFTAFLKAIKPRGGDLVLTEIPPKVYEAFQLLGFSQFFNIKENLEESVVFFADKEDQEKAGPFPKIFKCPTCSKKLRAVKAGRFRCSECKTILAIDNAGQMFLG